MIRDNPITMTTSTIENVVEKEIVAVIVVTVVVVVGVMTSTRVVIEDGMIIVNEEIETATIETVAEEVLQRIVESKKVQLPTALLSSFYKGGPRAQGGRS